MPVYGVLEIKVKDETMYSEYKEKAPPIINKYGGRYLVRGGTIIPASGDWNPERIVIIEFSDMEQLMKCMQSEEYSAIAPLRENATETRAIIVEGY